MMRSMRYWRQNLVVRHPTFSEEVLKSLCRRRSGGGSLRLTPFSKVLAHLLDDSPLALPDESCGDEAPCAANDAASNS